MSASYRELLLRFDEIGCYEAPASFDYTAFYNSILHLKKKLESIFNLEFELDDSVQDASFFCDLLIPKELITKHKFNYTYSVRISNFGKLATVAVSDFISQETQKQIIYTLLDEGFVFIPFSELSHEYDGRFEGFKKIYGSKIKPSWWDRYFDYL